MRSTKPCPGCGITDFHTSYSGPEGKRMAETGECFKCAFWEIRAAKPNPIVIGSVVYSIGPEPKPGSTQNRSDLGMGGRRFDIEILSTGQRYTTHNLWCGGEIPERFRDRIPNTARFLNGAERAQAGEVTCWNPSKESKGEVYPAYPLNTGSRL